MALAERKRQIQREVEFTTTVISISDLLLICHNLMMLKEDDGLFASASR